MGTSNLFEYLESIDASVFVFINSSMSNSISDFLMPIVTNDWLLRIVYGLTMVLLLIRGDKRQRWIVAVSALVLLASDQLAAGLLKPLIGRIRPCHSISDVHLLINCSSAFAMPSAHAANAFGQAALFGTAWPNTRCYLYFLAAVIALSRIFVGVHYPGDILVGAALGILLGVMAAFLFARFEARLPAGTDMTKPKD